MTNIELTSFILTIASFVASLFLGGFAIWLSKHFDDKSSQALNKVQDLTNEIKGLTDKSVSQNEQITQKMLEKVLEPNHYGVIEKNTLTNVEYEQNSNPLESLIIDLHYKQELQIEELRKQITKFKTMNLTQFSSDRSQELHLILLKWVPYPAHYVIIKAIIDHNVNSSEELKELESSKIVPTRSKIGMRNILKEGIVIGDAYSYKINPEYYTQLKKWVQVNKEDLEELQNLIVEEDEIKGIKERDLERMEKIQLNKTVISSRLKFDFD
ncbi:hypothetical protein [Pseudalkalibacillus hwajinpoensis]|uniref:hypothetical protein n=1 Tax=Guptibacillus hwajinpoensis TaxID=208199 RepID=UPI001CFDF9A8|nr:hypothetical protein [Pseudalkalibacillus hwajinpoensis]